MTINSTPPHRGVKDLVRTLGLCSLALALPALGACGGGTELPAPRPLILYSGARLQPERDRMEEIDAWVQPQLRNIREDPSFLIRTVPVEEPTYPWEELSFAADTATIEMRGGVPEARVPFLVYAHLHLMHRRGSEALARWLPEAAEAGGYELERAFLVRTADSWLYGRSVWDAPPYDVLDELIYARENGYLDAMIFTARPDAFGEARQEWAEENPGAIEEYRRWFVDTFDREPPGLREETSGG